MLLQRGQGRILSGFLLDLFCGLLLDSLCSSSAFEFSGDVFGSIFSSFVKMFDSTFFFSSAIEVVATSLLSFGSELASLSEGACKFRS